MDGDAAVEFAESRRAAEDDAEPASADVPAADGCARAPRDSLGILTEAILAGERDSGAIGQQSAPRVLRRAVGDFTQERKHSCHSVAWRQFPSGRTGRSRRPTPLATPRWSSSTACGCCRALDRGPAGADARGPGPVGGHGGDRPRSPPRRPALAGPGAQGGGPVPGQPAHPRPRDHAHVRPVHVQLGKRAKAVWLPPP